MSERGDSPPPELHLPPAVTDQPPQTLHAPSADAAADAAEAGAALEQVAAADPSHVSLSLSSSPAPDSSPPVLFAPGADSALAGEGSDDDDGGRGGRGRGLGDDVVSALSFSHAVSSPVAHAMRRGSVRSLAKSQSDARVAAEAAVAAAEGKDDDEDDEEEEDEAESGSLLRSGKKKNSQAQQQPSSSRSGAGSHRDRDRDRARSRQASRASLMEGVYTSRKDASSSSAGGDGSGSSRRGREYCDIPSIFSSTEEDVEYAARGEEPLLAEWQVRAAAAVVRHRQSTAHVYKQSPWSICSLSFRDSQAEQAFHYYFSQLNEHKLRRRLLLLNFLYMIYATVEWGTRTSKHYSRAAQGWITALRVTYILINAVIFSLSFVRRNLYRRNINLASTVLTVLTSTLIIVEGHLLRNIYSPFVVIVLLMYMVGSNIYVRTLFTVSSFVCWYNLLLYNFVCLVFNPRGDLSTLHSPRAALVQLVYYDLILVFFILTITYQTRKVEKQSRYAFLAYYVEAVAEEEAEADAEGEDLEREQNGASASTAGGDDFEERKQGDVAVSSASAGIDTSDSSSDARAATLAGGRTARGAGGPGPARGSLMPRNKAEELALLREINAHERAEDPFFLARLGKYFLPKQQVHHDARGATTSRPGQPDVVVHPSDSSSEHPGSGASDGADTEETVFSNDPLYSTLSLMRAKGITSMSDFVRLLAHQAKVRQASRQIRELPCICCASELPAWFSSYPYVQTNYRANYTARMCVRSMFQLHNETVNIWTEFIPCFIFILLFLVLESTNPVLLARSTPAWDKFFVLVGLVGSWLVRPICSGLAHTFYPMSNRAYVIWWGVDYVSILLCIMGYALVMGRFTFYCMLSQQVFFFISVLVLFLSTIAAVLFVASPGIRTSSFVLYVLFANGVPYIYQLVLTAADVEEYNVPKVYLMFWTLMWGLMLLGLLIKSAMIPERWWPGRFDIFFASHQWWHLLVNAGAACAYFTWKSYLQWRPTAQCPPSYGWDGP